MGRAHDIGHQRFHGMGVGLTNQRLGGEMKDEVRAGIA